MSRDEAKQKNKQLNIELTHLYGHYNEEKAKFREATQKLETIEKMLSQTDTGKAVLKLEAVQKEYITCVESFSVACEKLEAIRKIVNESKSDNSALNSYAWVYIEEVLEVLGE